MSLWRPFSLEDVDTEVPMNLRVTSQQTEVSQLSAVPEVSQLSAMPAVYPAYPGVPRYVPHPTWPVYPAPACQPHEVVDEPTHRPAFMSPGSSGYISGSASSSPLALSAPPAAVSPPKSLAADLEDADLSDDPDFILFQRAAMAAMAARNGGELIGVNPRMRRSVQSQARAGAADEDEAYRTSRERNNAAAKQSRDRRKLREIQLSLKVTYLKRQLATLRATLRARACARCHRSAPC